MVSRAQWAIIIFLLVVIAVLLWLLFSTPSPKRQNTSAVATTTVATSTNGIEPLSSRVSIAVPASGATVPKDFVVQGSAPGNWFFEASFPVQVRDPDGVIVGRTHANALGEWMTTANVHFEATVHVDSYSGPATLVLLKDNPSGLPENDDSFSISIVVR
jgi:hypothetical protein